MSEDDDLGGEFAAVDINGSCYSLVSCLAMDSLQTCAVYCGASADFASLKNDGSVTSTDGDDITVQLPPATGQEYHCIVSGSTGDGSTLFRFRAIEEKFGKLCVFNITDVYPLLLSPLQDVQWTVCRRLRGFQSVLIEEMAHVPVL